LDYPRVDLPSPSEPGQYAWTILAGSVLRCAQPETVVLREERFIHELVTQSGFAPAYGHAWVWPF
jgi:hypothetical protein